MDPPPPDPDFMAEKTQCSKGSDDVGHFWCTNLWVPDPPPPLFLPGRGGGVKKIIAGKLSGADCLSPIPWECTAHWSGTSRKACAPSCPPLQGGVVQQGNERARRGTVQKSSRSQGPIKFFPRNNFLKWVGGGVRRWSPGCHSAPPPPG